MLVTILWRLAGAPEADSALFDDVAAQAWYAAAVNWAAAGDVADGYGGGRFGPEDPITREQMAAMLWRYAGRPESDGSLSAFTDSGQVSGWAAEAMTWAVEQGLITGVGGGRLNPQGQASRAEAATILMRFALDLAQ